MLLAALIKQLQEHAKNLPDDAEVAIYESDGSRIYELEEVEVKSYTEDWANIGPRTVLMLSTYSEEGTGEFTWADEDGDEEE